MKSVRISLIVGLVFISQLGFAQPHTHDWRTIEDVLGRKGMEKDGYFKVTFTRQT
ncbi:MAG: hypothetical protein Q8922_13330 [Bacteroidota bacterium]|nr:hypothetical protein [Bacteroidota bacterium]MDP4233884.1 hypothetical protein [Bacteroidota bacterium]MDP4288904.1 hypothetical protein [Bacteroidota bacterium]